MEIMNLIVILLPIAYILHCVEEFYFPGGFIRWYHLYRPALSQQSPQYYLKVNIVGFSIITLISISVFFFHTSYNGFLIASTFLASNAIFTHIAGTIKTRRYSPGLITSCFLYLPICVSGYVFAFTSKSLLFSDLVSDLIIGSLYEIWNIYKYIKKSKNTPNI